MGMSKRGSLAGKSDRYSPCWCPLPGVCQLCRCQLRSLGYFRIYPPLPRGHLLYHRPGPMRGFLPQCRPARYVCDRLQYAHRQPHPRRPGRAGRLCGGARGRRRVPQQPGIGTTSGRDLCALCTPYPNGAVVRVGQAVAAGALLGYSGNTGLAGYPHLHFVVTAPGSMGYPYTSLPVTFRNTIPNPKSLESGMRYEAFPP